MTDEQAARLEQKIDRLLEMTPTIDALGSVLIRRQTVIDRTGLNKNTLSGHDAFEQIGQRKTYIEIAEIPVVKRRKRSQK